MTKYVKSPGGGAAPRRRAGGMKAPFAQPLPKQINLTAINELKVGRKIVRVTDNTHKLNPNSLRFLLGFMLNVRFDGNRLDASEYFEKNPSVYMSERKKNDRKYLTNKAISDILNDSSHIYYWQVECFARLFNMPVGAMLSLSRIVSLVRDGKINKAASDVRGLTDMVVTLRRVIENQVLSEVDLDDIARCFPGDTDQKDLLSLLASPSPRK